MKISYLSYSTIESFLNCKLGFVKSRELRDKLPSANKSSPAEKGSLAHACLEITFKIKSKNYKYQEILSITSGRKGSGSKLLNGFDEKWINSKRKLLQTKYKDRNAFYSVAEELAIKLSSKFNTGSKYENSKQALEDVLNTLKNAIFDQERIWFTTKPECIKYVEYELEAFSTFGYPMLMYIDLVLDMDKEIYIIDWKSGKKYWDIKSVENSLQFDFYAVGFYIDKNIKKPIRCWLDSLNQSKPFYTVKTYEQSRISDAFFANIWEEISNTDPKKAEPTFNEYCGYCLFYKSCPAIKIANEMKIETNSNVKSMKIDDIAEQMLIFSNLKKFYEQLYYKYHNAIKDKILNDEYSSSKYIINNTEVDNYKIEPKTVLKYIDVDKAINKELFEVSVSKVKDVFDDKTLKNILKKSINKPYRKINISKIKLQTKPVKKKSKVKK